MKTVQLKEICDKFTSIIKENKLRPITSFVELYSKNGMAHFGATDNRTTIIATIENENDIDNAVISLPDLYKLVKLTTKEEITLSNKGKYIEFKGNGKHKIPRQYDEMGNEIYLPLEMPSDFNKSVIYDSKDFKLALNRNKVGLFTEDGHEEFKLYHNKEGNLITSDSVIVAYTKNVNLPLGDIQSFIIEQLSNFDGEFKFSTVDSGYRISHRNYEMYIVNKLHDKFPVDMLEPFICEEKDMYQNKATLDKKILLSAIKRQDIFKTPYGIPSVIFEVKNNITLKNKNNTSEEELEAEVVCNMQMTVEIETSILLEVLKNMDNNLDIYFSEQAIRIEDSKGFYVISVVESE